MSQAESQKEVDCYQAKANHQQNIENIEGEQPKKQQTPFWLVGCNVTSSKKALNKKNQEPNPEQMIEQSNPNNQELQSKKPKEVDLLGIEGDEGVSFSNNVQEKQIQENKNTEMLITSSPSKKPYELDEIFQDLIPQERSERKQQQNGEDKELNYAFNQWNSIVSTQQQSIIQYKAPQIQIQGQYNNEENSIIQDQQKESRIEQNKQNTIEEQGFQFDMSEFTKRQDTNDFGPLSEIKEEPENQGLSQIPFPEAGFGQELIHDEQQLKNENNNFNGDQNNIEQQFLNFQKKEFQDDFNSQNDQRSNNLIYTTTDKEMNEKQQERQKQRYFSEVLKEMPSQYKLHSQDSFEKLDKQDILGQRKRGPQLQHNQSSKDILKPNQYIQNIRMSQNFQLNSNAPDPIDFYSYRPTTGYNMKRGATQVVDLCYEANFLKEEQKKQLKRDQFLIEFNTDPNQAVQKLEMDQKLSLQNIAEFLSKAEGLRKNTLGQFFGKNNEKNQEILREFCKIIDFKGQTIDEALRSLMSKFRLPGESQQIDRIMSAFSESYHEQNPTTFENSDIVYILAYSIMMLHTDLHSQKIEKKDKMKRQVFIERTQSVTKSKSVTSKILAEIYDRILIKQFECEQDAFERAYDILLVSHTNIQSDFAKLLSNDVKYFQNGSLFIKYGRQGNPKEKFVNLSQSEDKICWGDPKNKNKRREILIDDIYEITIGCDKTEVLRKNKVPKQLDNLCFSLLVIGHDNGKRSLDLKAKDEDQRNKWVRFCYQKLLNAKQQAFEFKKAKFSMQEYKEEIAGIWKSQIFEQFDAYWDYDRNQPLNMNKYYKFNSKNKENSQNLWKNVMKKKKQQKFNQVGVINESTVIREHIEDLQKNKELLFIRLWKQGLPHFVRKTLYKLSIGNKLEITEQQFELIKFQAELFFNHENDQTNHIHQSNNILFKSSIQDSPPSRSRNQSIYENILQMSQDLEEFLEKHPTFIPNYDMIKNVLTYTLFHRQDLNYIQGLVSICALIVNIFQNELDSFIYFINLIFSYHFKPLYSGDKTKIEFFNQFFYQSFQKEMKDLHERFIGLNLGPQNYLYGWLLSLFSDYFQDTAIVYRILDNFILEGEVYIFKAALGIIKMYEIDLRFSSFTIALKYLTEMTQNVNEEFLFDTIECIDINKEDYEKFFTDLKKSQAKSLIHQILVEL